MLNIFRELGKMRVTNLKKKLAVIGAGAGGLAVLQVFSQYSENFDIVCFEQTDKVGGTWNYSEKVGTNELGRPIHSSMYQNLKTNLPKEIMAFPDFPFPSHLPSFIFHPDVAKYLADYAEFHQLHKYIKFHSYVKNIKKQDDDRYKIVWETGKIKEEEEDVFDFLILCNGHYSIPNLPKFKGAEQFQGDILHSHDYRKPDKFEGKSVLVLGAGPSGVDIADDLLDVTDKTVYLSHRKKNFDPKMRPGIKKIREMTEIVGPNLIKTGDGETYEVDAIIMCTGYLYDFPFMDDEIKARNTNERLYPLYKHIVDARYPSIMYLGVTKTVLPFPHFNIQAKYIAAILTNQIELPSEEEMIADIERDYKWRREELGLPESKAHYLQFHQWDYNNDLCERASCPFLPTSVSNLYMGVHQTRLEDLRNYKTKNYRIIDEHRFVEVEEL